jgi:tetratricopeptide (TPR) repeat protein
MSWGVKWVLALALAVLLTACAAKDEQPAPLDAQDAEQLEQIYQEGRAAYLARRYDDAAGHFARVANADPEHVKARINWGASLSRAGRPLEALGHFQQVLEQEPDNAAAFYNWGAALARLGKHEEALDKFNRARGLSGPDLSPKLQRSLDGYLSRHRRDEPEVTPENEAPR